VIHKLCPSHLSSDRSPVFNHPYNPAMAGRPSLKDGVNRGHHVLGCATQSSSELPTQLLLGLAGLPSTHHVHLESRHRLQ
jgi:hypothetical protein